MIICQEVRYLLYYLPKVIYIKFDPLTFDKNNIQLHNPR